MNFSLKKTIIPINVDRNVSFRDYRHVEGKALIVADRGIFYTFQGEGPWAGHPSVFLRLAGCNIGAKEDCPWCDTKFQIDNGTQMDIESVFDAIKEKAQGRTKLAVVTGGEPLLQTKSLELLWSRMKREGWHMQLETNGYFVKEDTLPDADIVVSPKIPHNRDSYLPIKQDWLYRRVSLKYVVCADEGNPYYNIPQDAISHRKLLKGLYISGMAVYKRNPADGEIPNAWDDTMIDREETMLNYAHAAEVALRIGARVSYQMHLFGVKE